MDSSNENGNKTFFVALENSFSRLLIKHSMMNSCFYMEKLKEQRNRLIVEIFSFLIVKGEEKRPKNQRPWRNSKF